MDVAIPLFPGVTVLDAVGPYEVLQRVPDVNPVFVGATTGEVRSDFGTLGVVVDRTFADPDVQRPDVVVVPGGFEHHVLHPDNDPLVEWLKKVHPTTTWTTSVCSGALLLAKAGLLDGVTATTHRGSRWTLKNVFHVTVSRERIEVNEDARIITSAGVSAGIDMTLRLLTLLRDGDPVDAQIAQVLVEYFPHPDLQAETVDHVPAALRDRADTVALELMEKAGIPTG